MTFQINNLDKNILLRQSIRRNKYKNMAVFLFSYFFTISTTTITYNSLSNFINNFYYHRYSALILFVTTETLLLGELTIHLHNKFSILNNNFKPETAAPQKLERKNFLIPQYSKKSDEITAAKILKIMETHHHLLDISNKLNKAFSFPVVVTIAVNFQISTTILYYTVKYLPYMLNTKDAILILSSFVWSGLMLFEIFIISKFFEDIAEQVQRDRN